MSALEARDVWAAPPGAPDPVVRGVSLAVGAGESVALQGPNGGGKTTLALVLAGLWPARRGSVEFEGRPLLPGRPAGEREGLAALLQDPAVQLLQPTVAEELALAPRNLGRPESEVEREVARIGGALGLLDDLARDPRTLSAGRQQLLLIGAALTARPRLLVADEAGAHLDAAARARALEQLREERARGLAVVWVTQDPVERAAADRALSIGEDAALPADLEPAPPADEGPPGLVARVTPAAGSEGPRIAVGAPLELTVGARGVSALVGPNGSGKSVLLGAIAGVLAPPQVTVRREGTGLPPLLASQYPEHEVFEERVLDEVLWAAVQRGMGRDEAARRGRGMLASLGLGPGFEERRVWGLSGGEKRLVQLAGALLAPAGLLLLDEPTAGLDPAHRAAVARVVRERSERTPILIAGQDLPWLERLAGRIVRLGG